MNKISFPGLGIGEFNLNKIAFTLFGREVAWYGIIITVGIILAVLYVMNRAKKYEGMKEDDILDLAIYIIPISILGARLYYVLTSLDQYESVGEMFAIWNGGLAIYGAVIAGALTSLVWCKIKKVKVLKMYDMLVPAVMIGQIMGRWGNFFNVEAFGGPTDSIFRMCSPAVVADFVSNELVNDAQVIALNSGALGAHPTFFYESMWNLVGFLLINAYYRRKKYHGEIFFMYISWYGFGRAIIEGLRTDSLYVGPFRISQVIGLVTFAVGAFFLVWFYFKRCRNAQPILEKEGTLVLKNKKTEDKEDKKEKGDKDNGKDN